MKQFAVLTLFLLFLTGCTLFSGPVAIKKPIPSQNPMVLHKNLSPRELGISPFHSGKPARRDSVNGHGGDGPVLRVSFFYIGYHEP